MAEQMRQASEDPDLASAISLLIHPKMYKTVLSAVRERVDEATPHT